MALLFAFCSSKRQSRELSPKVDYLSYADTGSLASLNLNRAQTGYLWRLDTWGCYGFRQKLDMTEIIAGMSADEMRNFLGTPRFLDKGGKFDHYIYVVSTDYCKYQGPESDMELAYWLEIDVANDTVVQSYYSIVE